MTKTKYTVYGLYDSREPARVRYIGRTGQSLKARFRQHSIACEQGMKMPVYRWMRKVRLEGAEILAKQILVSCSEVFCDNYEFELIQKYGPDLTNVNRCGDWRPAFLFDSEAVAKASEFSECPAEKSG